MEENKEKAQSTPKVYVYSNGLAEKQQIIDIIQEEKTQFETDKDRRLLDLLSWRISNLPSVLSDKNLKVIQDKFGKEVRMTIEEMMKGEKENGN